MNRAMYTLHFDGMLRIDGNEQLHKNGLLGYGWLIRKDQVEIAHGFGIFARRGQASSSVAEYLALIEGLEALTDLRVERETVEIHGDAKCVIDQMDGLSAVSSPQLWKLHLRARKLTQRFHSLTWVWVPRRQNKQADALSRRGLRYLNCESSFSTNKARSNELAPLVDLRIHMRTT